MSPTAVTADRKQETQEGRKEGRKDAKKSGINIFFLDTFLLLLVYFHLIKKEPS